MKFGVFIGGILTIFALLSFWGWYMGYLNCMNSVDVSDAEGQLKCIMWMFENHPVVVEAKELQEQCDKPDMDCLFAVGKKGVADKFEDDFSEAVS